MLDHEDIIIDNVQGIVRTNKNKYYDSDQCREAKQLLQQLVDNPQYDTTSKYYGASSAGFVERHLQYLSTHSVKNLEGFISNLKLMTRIG